MTRTRKIVLGVCTFLAILIIVFSIYYWYINHHNVKFVLNDNIQIDLSADEQDSFLDWPIEFDVTITDLKTNKTLSKQFDTGNGPYICFKTSKIRPDIVLIEGYGRQQGLKLIFDLTNETVDNYSVLLKDSVLYKSFKTNYELSTKFQLTVPTNAQQ